MSTLLPETNDGDTADRLPGVSELYDWLGDLIQPAWQEQPLSTHAHAPRSLSIHGST